MSVCGNRTDSPGFFTSCEHALGRPCVCAAQVLAELNPTTTQETP